MNIMRNSVFYFVDRFVGVSEEAMDTTLGYYDANADEFSAGTARVDFSAVADRFLKKLPEDGSILDLGCGSGRDTKYFLEKGYHVTAIDGSKELCERASAFTGIKVRQMLFQELDDIEKYDGIWACASILHVNRTELPDVLTRMYTALKPEGIMYISFKYGTFSGMRNGRYFTDFTEQTFAEMLNAMTLNEMDERLQIIEQWVSQDVRPGREDEKWLNILLQKQDRKQNTT